MSAMKSKAIMLLAVIFFTPFAQALELESGNRYVIVESSVGDQFMSGMSELQKFRFRDRIKDTARAVGRINEHATDAEVDHALQVASDRIDFLAENGVYFFENRHRTKQDKKELADQLIQHLISTNPDQNEQNKIMFRIIAELKARQVAIENIERATLKRIMAKNPQSKEMPIFIERDQLAAAEMDDNQIAIVAFANVLKSRGIADQVINQEVLRIRQSWPAGVEAK